MKEISRELMERKAVICRNCGAIFTNAPPDAVMGYEPCPECGEGDLYWITPNHTWHPDRWKHNDD